VARKSKPGFAKDKVSASLTKQTVLGFFDNKGKVYTNYVPRGTTVNADYIDGALRKCLKALHQKWPASVAYFFCILHMSIIYAISDCLFFLCRYSKSHDGLAICAIILGTDMAMNTELVN
jgi:hypothetical protein